MELPVRWLSLNLPRKSGTASFYPPVTNHSVRLKFINRCEQWKGPRGSLPGRPYVLRALPYSRECVAVGYPGSKGERVSPCGVFGATRGRCVLRAGPRGDAG